MAYISVFKKKKHMHRVIFFSYLTTLILVIMILYIFIIFSLPPSVQTIIYLDKQQISAFYLCFGRYYQFLHMVHETRTFTKQNIDRITKIKKTEQILNR